MSQSFCIEVLTRLYSWVRLELTPGFVLAFLLCFYFALHIIDLFAYIHSCLICLFVCIIFNYPDFISQFHNHTLQLRMNLPLDNQTSQTEWKTALLAKVQLCEYKKTNLGSFCCSQPFVCQVSLAIIR